MQPVPAKMQPAPVITHRPTHVRHAVLGLTVAAYMITYMDRQVLAVTRPVIMKDLGISLLMMGNITFAFRIAYALFQIPGGWLGDRFGARRALTAVVTWWSAFTALTGLAWNAVSMLNIQVFFGLGEAGAFPIATRSLARWMRPTERGFAQGITHAGSRLGAALTPPIVVLIMAQYGWRAAFFVFGLVGVIWSIVWFSYYRNTPEEHTGVNQAERDLIGSGRKRSDHIPWRMILSHGNLWILAVMYFCYNFNLNVYQDWFPTYLHDSRGMTLAKMGFYASLPLFAGVLGDLAGGTFSDMVLKRTGNVNLARRWVAIAGFLVSAAATIPAVLAHDPKVSVAFYCVAFFASNGPSAFPGLSHSISAAILPAPSAVMNTLGNIGGALSAIVVTTAVSYFDWKAPFMITSAMCIIAAILYLKIDAGKRIA